jgi:osmoprotectant transport system permease protein
MGSREKGLITMLSGLIDFLTDAANWSGPAGIPTRIGEHLTYTVLALGLASVIALPVGLFIGHTGRGAFLAINSGNAARSLPTLGLVTLAVLLLGLGVVPVLIALVALAVPPILTATYAGIRNVDEQTIDAARGMGMRERQVLVSVELPIAMPLILSGLCSAALQVVSTATIAAYVALGGLGRYLIDGLSVRDYSEMLTGAVLVALLALAIDGLFAMLSRLVVSDGLTGRVRGTSPVDSATPTAPASATA